MFWKRDWWQRPLIEVEPLSGHVFAVHLIDHRRRGGLKQRPLSSGFRTFDFLLIFNSSSWWMNALEMPHDGTSVDAEISEVRFLLASNSCEYFGPSNNKVYASHKTSQINKDRPTGIFQTYHNSNCPLLKYASNVLNVCRALDLKRCSDFVFLFF